MNAQCYRVIFNKARGMLMVVSESARSQGKTSNPSEGGSAISQVAGGSQTSTQASARSSYQGGRLITLRSHLLLALGLATIVTSAHADATNIVADRNAVANQQAIILKSSNGKAQVNIQTPSAAGVSRNVFTQFDVGNDGAILNNSRVNAQTQLAGWVEGNPYLARGEARVILNEVNSSDPSRLSGFTEIAGGRAELIIANPAGITCAGCGFINAARTTLTTGNTLMDQGRVTGFDISKGNIRVDGDGLDTNGSDYTQILAKTTEINAAVYAKNLDVINGSNTVSYEANGADSIITPKSSTGSNQVTGVALDVSALGAMYAGKIRLIGTQKGMGVINAGSIIASSGSLQLDNNGNLINSGSLIANQSKVDITTKGNSVDNSGTIASSREDVDIVSATLTNSGVISSRDTLGLQQTDSITNSGEIAASSFVITASALSNSGKLLQTGSGQLAIDTSSLINSQGGIIGKNLYANASNPSTVAPTTKPPTSAANGSSVQGGSDTEASTPNLAPLPAITRDGNISVSNFTNTGSLYTNGKINIDALSAVNRSKSSLAAARITIAGNGQVTNADSRLQLDQINWQLATFDNSKGQITATKDINIRSADQINNSQGTIAAMGDITLNAGNQLNNTQGTIQSNANLTTNSSELGNTQGIITSKGNLTIDANGNLINTKGRTSSEGKLTVKAKDITNDQGSFSAQQLDIVANRLDNSGQLYGQTDNKITLNNDLQNSGLIGSQANTTINANSVTQTASGSLIAGMQADGSLLESGSTALTVTAKDKVVSQGKQMATGDMTISGSTVSLYDSVTQARNITMKATTGDISNQKAMLVAKDTLTLDSAQGNLNNQSGEISAQNLDIIAKRLDNTDGKITQTGNQKFMLSLAEGIDNTRGRIASKASTVAITTSTLDNSSGAIMQAAQANPSLSITANKVINDKGQVLSLGDQTWQVATNIDNQNGVIQAQRFDITASNLDNIDGRIIAVASKENVATQTKDSQLNVSGTINNTSSTDQTDKGAITSNTGSLIINAGNLQNNKAQISSSQSLQVNSNSLINSGSLYAKDITIANQNKLSNSGSIAALGDSIINTGSLTQSSAGQLIAGLSANGELGGNADLSVISRGQQTNAGTNIATGGVSLTGSDLDLIGSRNQSRNLLLRATAGDINLNKANTIVADLVTLNATGRLSNDSGVLQAEQFDWQISELSNIAGTINQTGNQAFTLVTKGDINNQSGYIGGKAESLTINTQGQLNNTQGSIVHSADVNTIANSGATIIADSLLNLQGKLISNGKMTATVNKDFDSTEGAVQAKSLQVAAGKLTNLNGQLVSQSGDLQLVATDIINQGEKAYIQSGQNLTIESKQLSNSDKATVMAQGTVTITADHSLNNSSDAVIASNESMGINGGTLKNDAQIASVNKDLTISATNVNNASLGRLQAATDTTIDTKQSLNNQGLIATTKTLKVTTGGDLNNQTGTLSAAAIDLLSQQGINNDSGLIIQSGTDEVLLVKSKGPLSNKNTKTPANSDKQFGIITNGDVAITSGSLDNLSGLIAANNLTIDSSGNVGNKQGQLQATKRLTIKATGNAVLDNQGGQIGANKVDLIIGDAGSGRINNNGVDTLIQAATDLTLTTGTLSNQSTKQSANSEKSQGILAGNALAINASTISNTGGQLLANDKITIKASNQLNNQSGTINSQDIAISDSNTAGRGLVVANSQGLINANKDLSITARGYSNAGGTISAVDQANINVYDSVYYGSSDTINAADLKLTTQGNFTNSGKLSAQNALTVSANNIDNLKGAEITSNGTTALNASANIDNRGLINGVNSYLDAVSTVNNYSNGRIYGDHVAIKATTLNNTPDVFTKTQVDNCKAGPGCLVEIYDAASKEQVWMSQTYLDELAKLETSDPSKYQQIMANNNFKYYKVTSDSAPVIAARRRLDIGVNTLNNNSNQARSGIFNEDFNGQAQIISNGEMHIGGRLDSNHQAIGRANTVTNKGASIESAGDMAISANTLNNVNADFRKTTEIVSEKHVNKWRFKNDKQGRLFDPSELRGSSWDYYVKETGEELGEDYNDYNYTETISKDRVVASDASRIISGSDMYLAGNTFTNEKSIILSGENKQIYGKELINENKEDLIGNEVSARDGSYQLLEVRSHALGSKKSRDKIGGPVKYSPAPIITDTYELLILNQEINKEVIDYGVSTPKVNELKSIANALQALTQNSQTTDNKSGNTEVSNTELADAANLLDKFAKAENSQLTKSQKQQIQDLIAAQNKGKPINATQVEDLIGNINTQINQFASEEIRTSGNKVTLPNGGLYGINPDSNADYLVESDAAFANYKNWLSSNYMLDRLSLDPSITQKRLGDGYYEQQYIRDQIMMLTGRYYLGNYGDQDSQYQGLMNAGITTAQALNLRPGVALSADQVAQLTTDMIWLVQQEVTLADGTSQKVLVPKVYTRQAVGQIDGTGNLIAANNINMQLTGDLSNQGNIVGHNTLKINANNLTNENGGLIKGNFVQIGTKNDLNNLSATLSANSAMQLDIGGDLNNNSLTYSTEAVKGASNGTRTGITQIASIYIGDGLKGQVDASGNPLTTFAANVGGNTTFSAGRLDNQGGSSFIDTKGNVALDAVKTSYQTNSIGDANNYIKEGETRDVGSNLTGSSDIIVKAGNNVTGTATQISSNTGTVGIIAGNNITFSEGRNTQNLSTATKSTDKGFLGKKITQERFDSQSDNAITSNLEGNKVTIQAGNNISLTGTNAISDKGVSLTAGGNLDILAAQNTSSQSSSSQTKKSGLFGADGGMGFTIGKQQNDDSNASTALTHTASNVGAIDGNVIITAGGNYQQTGSNLIAGMRDDSDKDFKDPNRGNTVVRAKSINIDNALDIYTNHSEQKSKQSGMTVSVSNSLVDSAKSINALVDAGGNTDSVRMKGMAGVAGALKVKALAKEANSAGYYLLDGNLKGMGNTRSQATIGSQKSQSNSSSYTEQNQASSITTNNLALIATGAGKDSNINVKGSNLDVTNNALFQADNDFNVNAAAQNSQTRSNNKSSSTAIGGYADSSGSGGITASASKAKGHANSDSTTYANSHINVGGTTTFDIGNNVNIKGGVINTDRAQGTIGGDVNIESLQDTATYDSKQKNMGFSADLDLAKGTGSSLSVNGGKTNLNSDYKAVGEQSGIFANQADIVAEGKGTFKGGVFVTSKAAQDNGNSSIVFKQGMTSTDLKNNASHEGDAISIGLSVGKTTGKPQATMNGLGYGTDGDSDSSITKGGVSGYNDKEGIFTTDNREVLAGQLDNVFDATRVNEELAAQTQITKDFGKEAPKAVGDFANNRIKAIIVDTTLSNAEKNAAIAKWDEGGIYRVAAHTALGALGTGSVEGALTTGGVAAAAPTLNDIQFKVTKALIDKGMSADIANGTASGVISLTLLGVGSAAGLDTSSTVTATNVDANNRQLHPQEKELAKVLFEKAKKQGWKRADGKSYTLQEIEDALRWANSTKYNEKYNDDVTIIVGNNAKGAAIDKVMYDNGIGADFESRLWKNTASTSKTTTFTQNFSNIKKPDTNLVNLIQNQTKSYGYSWTGGVVQPYKGKTAGPTSGKPKPRGNQAPIVTQKELDARNQAVKNGADLRDGKSIQAVSDATANKYVTPTIQAGFGAAEVAGGAVLSTTCATGITCVAAGAVVANGLDNIATGATNFGGKPSQQVPSVALDIAGVPRKNAAIVKVVADLGTGGILAVGAKPALTVTKPKTLTVSETRNTRVENNFNVDNNALDNSYPREEFWYKDDIYAPTVVRNPEVMNGLLRQNGIELKQGVTPQEVFENVYQTPSFSRPDPSSYLSPSYIANWNSKWDDGAVRFATMESVKTRGTIGPPKAFVIPKSEYDNLIRQTGGDLAEVEVKLSLRKGYLTNGDIGIYHVKPQSTTNVRMPSGNEGGANTQWLIGGKTANGYQEGILDLTNGDIQFKKLN